MKKIVVLLVLLLSALPAFAGSLSSYRPVSTALPDLPKYALAGATVTQEQRLFAAQGGVLPLTLDLSFTNVDQLAGELGQGWSHSYEITLHENPDGTMVMTGGAGTHFFFVNGTGYKPRLGDHTTLTHNGDGSWSVTRLSGLTYHFGSDKKLTAIIDRYGNSVSIDNTIANQTIITDPAGRQAVIHYSVGKIDWIKDPAQNQYDFAYHATTGLLESVRGPAADAAQPNLHPRWEYRYTAADSALEYVKDPEGHITKYVYTGGRLTRKVDPAGVLDMNGAESADAALHSTTWVYGVNRTVADSRAVTRMAKDGGHWVYTYADGVLVAKEDPNGAKTQHLFYLDVPTTDPRYGLPKEDITPIDATTLRVTAYVSYDATGKPTEIKSFPRTSTGDGALDRHLLYSYDTYGRMTSTTDLIVGTTTSIAYVMTDGQETVTLTAPKLTPADASGPQTVLVYRSDGQLERITDPLGRQSVYGYTATGFLSTITDTSSGIVATLGGFDNLGRPQTVTVSKSGQPDRVTTLDYDALGRLTSNTRKNVALVTGGSPVDLVTGGSPVDLVTAFNYDLLGNLVALTDAKERTTTYAYNDRGEPTRITDPLGQVTELLYSASGCGSCGGGADKLFGIKDAKGQQTDFSYYLTGKLKSESDSLGKRMLYTYTSGGNVQQKLRDSNQNGEVDTGDQLLLSYVYATDGQLLSKTDHVTNTTTRFTYDANGRLHSASNPASTATFDYYANGWLKSVNDGSTQLDYQYDAVGRRDLVTVKQGETILQSLDSVYDPTTKALSQIVSSAGTFTFGLDAWGRRGTLTYPNGVVASYAYNDQADWLTGISTKDASGATLLDLAYTKHDKIGNRQERVENNVATTYAYDATDQLTQAKTGASEENFTYDAVGNRESGPTVKETADKAYDHDAANRMLEGRKDDYSYDDLGNRQYRYLDAGHSKYWQYSWDGDNQLIETKLVKGTQTLRTVSFKYDPFGRRIEKQVVEGLAPQVTVPVATTTTYIYDNEDIVLETINNGATTTQAHYLHGPGIDELLARVNGDQSVYYHADGLGSIVAISDSTKAIVQRYSYDVFGMVTASDPEFENVYTYTGREWDKEIGLYYYRARYYDPMEGRFISKDPIGFAGGDVNLYRYVQNNPINLIDPTGLDWFRPKADPYVVGREGSQLVEPGKGIGKFIDDYVPAGHTFGTLHDDLVDMGREAGLPDALINIPTMLGVYVLAVGTELDNSLLKLLKKEPLLVCH